MSKNERDRKKNKLERKSTEPIHLYCQIYIHTKPRVDEWERLFCVSVLCVEKGRPPGVNTWTIAVQPVAVASSPHGLITQGMLPIMQMPHCYTVPTLVLKYPKIGMSGNLPQLNKGTITQIIVIGADAVWQEACCHSPLFSLEVQDNKGHTSGCCC